MKTLILTSLLLVSLSGATQVDISPQMRIGFNTTTHRPIISPGLNLMGYGLSLMPELIINTADNAPAQFGLKISYEREIWKGSLQAGFGEYYDLYTTDKYDAYKNGLSGMLFISVHYDRFFVEYDYNNGSIFSFGMRENILN